MDKHYDAKAAEAKWYPFWEKNGCFHDEPGAGAPYSVDYSLPVEDRFAIVKTYYETNYSDGNERFVAFQQDTVAVQYLGELDAPVYDYFLDGAN